jgi:hypothetical protein
MGWRSGPDEPSRPRTAQTQRLFRLESLPLDPRPELELLLPLPLPLLLLLLLLREDPSLRLPPRSRLLSDELRDEPPLPRDELPDPDDLFDWFAIGVLLRVSRMRLAAHSFRHRCDEIGSREPLHATTF